MEEQPQAELVVEKTTQEIADKKAAQTKLIAELNEQLAKVEEELEGKKYLIEGGKDMGLALHAFIMHEAKWKFTEALGVIEVVKTLESFNASKKEKDLMVGPLEIEALYYFMSKHEGVGLASAKSFIEMLRAVNPAKSRKEEDTKKYEQIVFRIQSLEHGIDPEEIKNGLEESEN